MLKAKVEALERLLAAGLPRIIPGQISLTGAVARGTGFSSVRNSLGNFTITFTNPFINAPIVVLTPISGVIARLSGSPTTTSFTISTLDASFANADFDTSFCVFGVPA
jgi:hypothetical protein